MKIRKTLTIEQKARRKIWAHNYHLQNKDEIHKRQKAYRSKHLEHIRKISREYYYNNKERVAKTNHELYLRKKPFILEQSRLYYQRTKDSQRARRKLYAQKRTEIGGSSVLYYRKYTHNIRMQLLSFFGGKCLHCGNNDYRVLQLDHIHGGGSKEFKEKGMALYTKYKLTRDYPDEARKKYQLLCANCNWIKRWTNIEYTWWRGADGRLPMTSLAKRNERAQ